MCNLLFRLITTIYSMTYVLEHPTQDLSISLVEIVDQSSCSTCTCMHTVIVKTLIEINLGSEEVEKSVLITEPTLIGIPFLLYNK